MKLIPERQTALGLLRKYDPDPSYDLAQRLLDGVERVEAEQWFNHPCTQALIASLDGDMCDVASGWLSGGYTSDRSTDDTAQMNSKAQGRAQCYFELLERIREIRSMKIKEDEDES